MIPTAETQKLTHEEQVATSFVRDVAKHELTVEHDDGLYRHLLFKQPGWSGYWFELVMWPGALTISGDMGTYTFRREPDMIPWFLAGESGINPDYWAQKLQNAADVREYDPRLAKEMVDQEVDEWAEDLTDEQAAALRATVAREVLCALEDEHQFRENLDSFSETLDGHRYSFEDTWDWSLRRHTFHFLWACHAIRWGLTTYQAATSTTEGAPS